MRNLRCFCGKTALECVNEAVSPLVLRPLEFAVQNDGHDCAMGSCKQLLLFGCNKKHSCHQDTDCESFNCQCPENLCDGGV